MPVSTYRAQTEFLLSVLFLSQAPPTPSPPPPPSLTSFHTPTSADGGEIFTAVKSPAGLLLSPPRLHKASRWAVLGHRGGETASWMKIYGILADEFTLEMTSIGRFLLSRHLLHHRVRMCLCACLCVRVCVCTYQQNKTLLFSTLSSWSRLYQPDKQQISSRNCRSQASHTFIPRRKADKRPRRTVNDNQRLKSGSCTRKRLRTQTPV